MINRFSLGILLMALIHVQSVLANQPDDFSAFRHKLPSNLENDAAQNKSLRLIVRYYNAAVDAEIQSLEKIPQQDKA